MNTKLTLTIEQSVIEKAKKYARNKERSLSDLIENYLKALTNNEIIEKEETELTSTIKSLRGSFKMPKNFDYKKELTNRLTEKYL
jgi:predicted CopG family antitoxin